MELLESQDFRDFEVVVIDNSGQKLVRAAAPGLRARVIENESNAGYGPAVNQAARLSEAAFIAVLNDDAEPQKGWLGALVRVAGSNPAIGMCASRVRLAGENTLDSAGMLIASDGSSKQRGHGEPADTYGHPEEVLLPSGSAAIYRREMFDELGGFDEDFFLYCEDTDLGLRARWAGWRCLYVPDAIVDHHYSHSAGRASGLKAFYVERNRLYLVAKNFPAAWLWRVPFASMSRYFWHIVDMAGGQGKAAHFRRGGNSPLLLIGYTLKAYLALLRALPALLRKRREIRRNAKLGTAAFTKLLRQHSISTRRVASL
jgi:GT2 family glycosyltransferase